MIRQNNNLIFNRGIQIPLACNDARIVEDKNGFITDLTEANGLLPNNPPFEIHPYKSDFLLQNFEMYIIGTFPPISYILDNDEIAEAGINSLMQPLGVGGALIKKPWIPFYHGNKGSMWDFLLTNQEIDTLHEIVDEENDRDRGKQYLKDFLIENKINYADIINSTQRNLNNKGRYDSKDANLNNVCGNIYLIQHLLSNQNAKYLLFNSSSTFGNQGIRTLPNGLVNVNQNIKSFDLFVRQCQELGLIVQLRIENNVMDADLINWQNINELNNEQRSNKIIFELKIKNPLSNEEIKFDKFDPGSERIFTVITGPSPSAIVQLGLIGNLICDNWLIENPLNTRNDFIRWVYLNFRNIYENLNLFYELNG